LQVICLENDQMIRVLLMANDSLLAAAIASTLTAEIDLDVVRLTRRALGKGDRYSVVIIVDEGDDSESLKIADLFRQEVTLLVIIVSLKDRNIHVFESYQLHNPGIERVIDLVRDFGRANLKKKPEGILARAAHGHDRHLVI
jgi:hypothetical protein